jgi:CRISPR-associated protein Cas1
MNHLYINQAGSQIGVRQNQLVLRKTNGEELFYPLHQIDRITVTTRVNFSGAAVNELFKQGISTTFCSQSGYIRGFWQSTMQDGGQVKRRAKQYRLMEDAQANIKLATNLVVAKIRNQQRVLSDWQLPQAKELTHYAEMAKTAMSSDVLRGYEGQAAKIYFSAVSEKLRGTPFVFEKRQRPATDPINTMLSFGYSLLQSEFAMAVNNFGLDRFVGFLHVSDGAQPALILDLMEPFRPIVDRLVVRSLSCCMTPDDFYLSEQGCRMQDLARNNYLQAWELLMNQTKCWNGQESSYRRLIERQTSQWANYLDGVISEPDWWRFHDS